MEGSPIGPTAKLLDTFLRVTSRDLFSRYGKEYLQLLARVQTRVLPVLSTEDPLFSGASVQKNQLAEFLEKILDSNGHEIDPINDTAA